MATYKVFQPQDIVSTPKTKIYPLWSDSPLDANTVGEVAMINFFTASADTASFDFNYFWNVYGPVRVDSGSGDFNLNEDPQFSIAVGTTSSINLFTTDATVRQTYPSNAVYRQFANVLLGQGSDPLGSTPNTQDVFTTIVDSNKIGIAYFIAVARDRMKDGVDPNTWQLILSGTAGTTVPSGMSLIASPAKSVNQTVFDIQSGSLDATTLSASYDPASVLKSYGLFYSDKGIFVLDASKLSGSVKLTYGPSSSLSQSQAVIGDATTYGYNSFLPLYNWFTAIKSGSLFQARSTELVQATHYFVRAQNFEFNSSENPTWRTGSNNEIQAAFYNQPTTFITSVGLYDGDDVNVPGKLVAVAKLSKPLIKTPDSEALIRIRLDFVWLIGFLPIAYSFLHPLFS